MLHSEAKNKQEKLWQSVLINSLKLLTQQVPSQQRAEKTAALLSVTNLFFLLNDEGNQLRT